MTLAMTKYPTLSRRNLLLAAGSSACVSAIPAAVGAHELPGDPRGSADGLVKIGATLDGSPAFWSYSGVIYAVRPAIRPVPILAVTGCQACWALRQPDGSFHMAAPLLSFFRSPDDGSYLDEFENPFSGARNAVQPNKFMGRGYAIFPADGSSMRIGGDIPASASAPKGFKNLHSNAGAGRVQWSVTTDAVVLMTDQFFDVVTQPQGEAQTRTADRAQFFDSRVTRLRARFSATTISPWLGWMDMGSAEGHLVWHTYGEKLFSVVDLPADYRERAGPLLEGLTARPNL